MLKRWFYLWLNIMRQPADANTPMLVATLVFMVLFVFTLWFPDIRTANSFGFLWDAITVTPPSLVIIMYIAFLAFCSGRNVKISKSPHRMVLDISEKSGRGQRARREIEDIEVQVLPREMENRDKNPTSQAMPGEE